MKSRLLQYGEIAVKYIQETMKLLPYLLNWTRI